MKKVITFILVALTLMGMASTVYAEETGCFQTKDNWIIRVYSEGTSFVLEVVNPVTGLNIPLTGIKAFIATTTPCGPTSTPDLCVFETTAQNPDVSLACDAVAGTAYIFHDQGGAPHLTTITDITKAGTPILTPGTTLLNFGTVTVNTTTTATLTARNTGTANLTISPVVSPAAPFSKITDTCSNATLIPAGTCTITIRFAPTSVTTYNRSFNILSNGGNATISLTGAGKAAGAGFGF